MTSAYLSRIRLRRDVPAASLAPLLLPDDAETRQASAHRLIWTLFADDADRKRDFLWREAETGDGPLGSSFFTLSSREPADEHGLFDVETKPFEPSLGEGDRLSFSLRANPVVSKPAEKGERGRRHDVVMDRLKDVKPGERARQRMAIAVDAGRDWLGRQGERNGFTLCDDAGFHADGYRQRRIPRGPKAKPMTISMLDLSGVIEITDPAPFFVALMRGFGKAKAFGCGLMLIKRA